MADPKPLAQIFAEAMGDALGPEFPTDLGLAVSGGGDSMAMLHVAADWARVWGLRLWVVTIDHGLRDDSATEAALVKTAAQARGLPHATLTWTDWDGQGNLQDAARRARLDLIARWRGVVRHVLFAHTRDDQAETVLMRLARGSGVEGLSAMAPVQRVTCDITGRPRLQSAQSPPWPDRIHGDWHILRPLLGADRAALRHFNRVNRIDYIDDPSNADPRFDRVRIRALLAELSGEGLDAATLAQTATRLRRARVALERRAYDMALACQVDPGPAGQGLVVLDRDRFAAIEPETQLRILAAALRFVASAPYRPRAEALEQVLDRWLSGGTATLQGCVLLARDRLIVAREHGAVAQTTAKSDVGPVTWDRRWILRGLNRKGVEVRALGPEGWIQAGRPPVGLPRQALLGLPAVRDGATLIACPPVGFGLDHAFTLRPSGGHFPQSLLSH